MPKKPPINPSQQERLDLLHDSVLYEIAFALGVSAHDPTDYASWEHMNFARLGHARTLYSFFEEPATPRKFYDDAVSEDFGFPHGLISRPQGDHDRLNKQLMHISYERLEFNRKNKPWPNSLLSCLHQPCVDFIKHVLRDPQWWADQQIKAAWEALLEVLTSGHELLVSRRCVAGNILYYEFTKGRLLTSGLPEITPLFWRE